MKFLCLECRRAMEFTERHEPGDGTFGASFRCPGCGRAIALLANPMETQLVSALGVRIGGEALPAQPLELVRSKLVGREGAVVEPPAPGASGRPSWSPEAQARLERVPAFVRGMVKRLYTDYAVQHAIAEITPEVMDRARVELGLEGM